MRALQRLQKDRQQRERTEEEDARDERRCYTMVERALERDAVVRHLLHALADRGLAVVPRKFFHCEPCDTEAAIGYYERESGVHLCRNVHVPRRRVIETIRHELVHAYDDATRELDPDRLDHVLCTEVRAARLSSDCSLLNEVNRGNVAIDGQARRCVRRRAALSASGSGRWSELEIEASLDRVFPLCYSDLEPFGFVP